MRERFYRNIFLFLLLRSKSFCAISSCMEALLTYRGKRMTQEDVAFIRGLIAQNPDDSRRRLSEKLCQAWDWRQANGALRDMVCRGLMLALERAGYIELPTRRQNPRNPLVHREKPSPVPIDPDPIEGPLSSILPLEIRQVRRTALEKLCNSLIEQYHYLGYCQPVGEHLKYLVFAGQRPIAGMVYSSAPRHIGCRDRFIGWPVKVRRQNLHLMAYQSRFLILPLGEGASLSLPSSGTDGEEIADRLATTLSAPGLLPGDLCGPGAVQRDLLQGGQLAVSRKDHGAGQKRSHLQAQSIHQGGVGEPVMS